MPAQRLINQDEAQIVEQPGNISLFATGKPAYTGNQSRRDADTDRMGPEVFTIIRPVALAAFVDARDEDGEGQIANFAEAQQADRRFQVGYFLTEGVIRRVQSAKDSRDKDGIVLNG